MTELVSSLPEYKGASFGIPVRLRVPGGHHYEVYGVHTLYRRDDLDFSRPFPEFLAQISLIVENALSLGSDPETGERLREFNPETDTLEISSGKCPPCFFGGLLMPLPIGLEDGFNAASLSIFAEYSNLRQEHVPGSREIAERAGRVLINPLTSEEQDTLNLYLENRRIDQSNEAYRLGLHHRTSCSMIGGEALYREGARLYERVTQGENFLEVTVHREGKRLDLRFLWLAVVHKASV